MKIKLFLFLILLPAVAFSQVKRSGLSIGVNFGNWIGDTEMFALSFADEMNSVSGFSGFDFESGARIGLSIIAFTEYPVTKSFMILPELGYTQRGIMFSGDGTYSVYGDSYQVDADMTFQLDYIDAALLLKYHVGTGNIKPYLIAGPGAGYLISSKMKVDVSIEGESESETEDMEPGSEYDVNLNIGAGIDISDLTRLELQYSSGFMSILDDDPQDDIKYTNEGLCISIAVYF